MNRLQIVQKYMSLKYKIEDVDKYNKAQSLSYKISKQQDKRLSKIVEINK